MNPALPASLSSGGAPALEARRWKRWGWNFLILSIAAHILFGVAATYLIVQTIQAKRKQTFAGAPQAPSAAARSVEHKVQMQKKQQTMSAPAPVKRITTTSNTKLALPAMPAMPRMDSQVVPMAMAGMGGTGLGLGMGSGHGNDGGGGGSGLTLFGLRGSSTGLEGTFYDYKMDQAYQPIKGIDAKAFARIAHDVLPVGGDWHPDTPYKHFTSFAKLHGRYFLFPAIQDNQAGAAFQSPRSGPGSWLAVYRGAFASQVSGSFRFVGFGDNVMIVKVGDRIVLDASDHGYTGAPREAHGDIAFPGKDKTPLFAGPWLELTAGEAKDIEIAVGDEGGTFCSGLFIQPRETAFAQGDRGVPKLPIFALGNLTDADRQLLSQHLPPECLQGPVFRSVASSSADSLFNH